MDSKNFYSLTKISFKKRNNFAISVLVATGFKLNINKFF